MVQDERSKYQKYECAKKYEERREWEALECLTIALLRVQIFLLFICKSSPFNVVTRHSNLEDNIDPEQVNEGPEECIVSLSDTIRNERTVVVKHLDTYITRPAMDGALGAENHASKAELEARNKSFLSV